MHVVNLTPHILIFPDNIIIEPSGIVARCYLKETVSWIRGIKVISRFYGRVTGLPNPSPDTYYVVSAMVRLALPHRLDLMSPNHLERDDEGNIIKVNSLLINTGVYNNV